MAKRFTDTNKWEDEWFLNLEDKHKLFYLFLLDRCDHAGLWKVNMKLANFLTGQSYKKEEVLDFLIGRVIEVNSKYWYVLKFIPFQYGALRSSNNAHKGVLKRLSDFADIDLLALGASEGLPNDSLGHKDKEKDKDKEKEKEKEPQELNDLDAQRLKEEFKRVIL